VTVSLFVEYEFSSI